jgi:hypothetical protein
MWFRAVDTIVRMTHMLTRIPDGLEPGLREASRIVVAFENTATRELALRSSPDLAKLCSTKARNLVQWLAFASLSDSTPAREAAVADLLIFAITRAGDLPLEVKLWIENWVCQRNEREGAVVGLILAERHSSPGDVACLKEIYLRHAAHRAGMDYLSQVPAVLPVSMPDSLESYSYRAGQVTSVLDKILHTNPPPPTLL